jgi:hypothetical protein
MLTGLNNRYNKIRFNKPLPNMVLWFDAADISSFIFSIGNSISQWSDKSGNANHAQQATGANQPTVAVGLNGKNVVSFNGSTMSMKCINNTTFGIFEYYVVCKSSTNSMIFSRSNAGAFVEDYDWLSFKTPGNGTIALGRGSQAGLTTELWSGVINISDYLNKPVIMNATYEGFERAHMYINDSGKQPDQADNTVHQISAAPKTYDFNIGVGLSTQRFTGYIAEIIIYPVNHNPAEKRGMFLYLANKWGIGI